MVKYIGPKVKITRRLGLLKGLTNKTAKTKTKTPGQHGKKLFTKTKRTSLSDDYKQRLIEKQKLRFNYGVTEKQLVSYYQQAKRKKGSTGTLLLELLESRLDCIVYRLGFAPTIPSARQIINHGHLVVNNRPVTIPSFLCQTGDVISVKPTERAKKLVSENFVSTQQKRKLIQKRMKKINFKKFRSKTLLPSHLEVDEEKIQGKVLFAVNRGDVLIKINELKVVEYYSR
jgi:small subunit ribosomal protein S4